MPPPLPHPPRPCPSGATSAATAGATCSRSRRAGRWPYARARALAASGPACRRPAGRRRRSSSRSAICPGDKCNDLLVRNSSGALTRYDGSCGKAFSPSGPKLALGTGWNIYNTLTSPGDLTGDARADLLARTSAGELYLYADGGAGKLKARVKIGTGRQIYNSVAGVGDITGDGGADVVARDTAGVLWRYNGTGTGTLSARVKIGSGWQTYKALS
ncbi:VCBS repeat-containing protein [Streptomyces sp. V1I1]|uniref:FG-GAP repeat domain-containing protein n=1 Tax=Streptomyces sp. V1I1 TaxID=3042272 RepID=UPI00278B1A73|nr:VCBS repeat-containing protein [Streptomyces sp. V1I1]MDQ0942368.1 hypothetical protein [Streptomyces sp. V1I1]